MNEEVKKETEEKKEEVKEVKKDETTEKPSKSFLETIGSIWNSKPVRFIRKVVKVTLITGAALIGVTGAAKTGCSMALEEHDAKNSEDSPEETTEETPEIPDEIPGDSEETTEE
ncbi:MAG TPA: hypothetical protein DCR12_04575 [Lachnospiraceae bacterium]|nr:hypothetical protein [Lachnospiraceae bacterium]